MQPIARFSASTPVSPMNARFSAVNNFQAPTQTVSFGSGSADKAKASPRFGFGGLACCGTACGLGCAALVAIPVLIVAKLVGLIAAGLALM